MIIENQGNLGLGITIDGNGNVITAGHYGGYQRIPYACVITGWVLYEGSDSPINTSEARFDVWIDNAASFPPTVADTIFEAPAATNNPHIHNGSSEATASGGTMFLGGAASFSVSAGALIAYNVDSNTTGKIYTLQLLGYKI